MNSKNAEFKKLKICMLSDSPLLATGYSNQSKLLAKYLSDRGHDIHYLANSYTGQPLVHAKLEDGTEFNYKIYGQKSQYFSSEMGQLMKEIKPDIFYILLDTFMLHGNPRNPQAGWFLNVDTSPSRTMFWFPSDGGGRLPLSCETILQKIDRPVAMSQFGQKQVKDVHNLNVDHIPHGTEPDRFYRLPEEKRNEIRAKWGLTGKFVIGSVFRNQPRKNPDRYFKTFNLIKEKVPNAVLFLHTDPNDQAGQILLQNQIAKYNLENRVIFTGMSSMRAFDWADMNEVYNTMDAFFLPTSGEGFGIPIIEAMACKIPVIATSYTTTPELVELNKAGFGAKLAGVEKLDMFDIKTQDYDNESDNGTMTGGQWEVERGLIDIKDAAELLIKLAEDPELCKELGENGRKAVLEKYDFNKHVGPAFEKIMWEMAQ